MEAVLPIMDATLVFEEVYTQAPGEFEVGGVRAIAPTPHVVLMGVYAPCVGATACAKLRFVEIKIELKSAMSVFFAVEFLLLRVIYKI